MARSFRSISGNGRGWANLKKKAQALAKQPKRKKRQMLDRPLRDSKQWEQQHVSATAETAATAEIPEGPSALAPCVYVYECQRCLRRITSDTRKNITGRRALRCEHCGGGYTWIQQPRASRYLDATKSA